VRSTLLTIGVVAAVSVCFAGPASGQTPDDPYGETTTSGPGAPTPAASCELSITSGEPGASVTATVSNVPFGTTVRILFGGIEVGRGTTPVQGQSVGAPVLLGGRVLPRQAARTTLSIDFVVPDVEPGSYLVTAVGVDFTCRCSPETGGMFDVLAAAVGRRGGGALARTGIYVLLLLAIAFALLVVGRVLVQESRRRREVERNTRRAAHHLNRARSSISK
jgi:hypothetical protein